MRKTDNTRAESNYMQKQSTVHITRIKKANDEATQTQPKTL